MFNHLKNLFKKLTTNEKQELPVVSVEKVEVETVKLSEPTLIVKKVNEKPLTVKKVSVIKEHAIKNKTEKTVNKKLSTENGTSVIKKLKKQHKNTTNK